MPARFFFSQPLSMHDGVALPIDMEPSWRCPAADDKSADQPPQTFRSWHRRPWVPAAGQCFGLKYVFLGIVFPPHRRFVLFHAALDNAFFQSNLHIVFHPTRPSASRRSAIERRKAHLSCAVNICGQPPMPSPEPFRLPGSCCRGFHVGERYSGTPHREPTRPSPQGPMYYILRWLGHGGRPSRSRRCSCLRARAEAIVSSPCTFGRSRGAQKLSRINPGLCRLRMSAATK